MEIRKLIIFSSRIKEQLHFYRDVLEFPCIFESEYQVDFQIGESLLSLKYNAKTTPYHFAFNIPAFSGKAAQDWLSNRVKLIPSEGDELVIFKKWKARALYFCDPDGNIVEFIAREAISAKKNQFFSTKDVLNISEIGIGTTDIQSIVKDLNDIRPIALYDGDLQRFCALGNEHGLFIIANSNEKFWMPTNDSIHASAFEVSGTYNFKYINGKISEIV